MLARTLCALSIAITFVGCGLTLDLDPPDPEDGLDGGGFDAGPHRDADTQDDGGAPIDCVQDEDCDDGEWCSGEERCEDGVCKAGELPCGAVSGCLWRECDDAIEACGQPVSTCAEGELCTPDGLCVPPPECESDAECPDDRDPCNGGATCIAGLCVSTPPLECDPGGDGCAREECVPGVGCTSVPRDERCDDGATCTEDHCVPSAAYADDDGCVFRPRDALCPALGGSLRCSQSVCVGEPAAIASGGSGCGLRLDSSRCLVNERCVFDPTSDTSRCVPQPVISDCAVGADCDDGDPCNGRESCLAAVCANETSSCPDDDCFQGWCDLSTGAPVCALRATDACRGLFPPP